MKYLKYLIIRDPPPEKEKKNDLGIYFKKLLKIEEILINQILDNLDNLLSFNEEEFDEQCQEWDLSNENIFKLNISLELIKQNNNKPLELDKNNVQEKKESISSKKDVKH